MDFRKRHPITTYDHYEKLVQQVASGEEKVVVMETPTLTMTSGSSGCCKMLLNTKETNSDYFLQGLSVCVDIMRKCFPGTMSLQTTFRMCYPSAERYSEAGLKIVAAPFSSEDTHHLCTSPAAILQVEGETRVKKFVPLSLQTRNGCVCLFIYVCVCMCVRVCFHSFICSVGAE